MQAQAILDVDSCGLSPLPAWIGLFLTVNGVTIVDEYSEKQDLAEVLSDLAAELGKVTSPDYFGQVSGTSIRVIAATNGSGPNGYAVHLVITNYGTTDEACGDINYGALTGSRYITVVIKIDGTTFATVQDFYAAISTLIAELIAVIDDGTTPYTATDTGVLHICGSASLYGTQFDFEITSVGLVTHRFFEDVDTPSSGAGTYNPTLERIYWPAMNDQNAFVPTDGVALTKVIGHMGVSQFHPAAIAVCNYISGKEVYSYQNRGAGDQDTVFILDQDLNEVGTLIVLPITAGSSTQKIHINKDGILFIPTLSDKKVYFFDVTVDPAVQAAFSPITLIADSAPTWVDSNPETTHGNYGFCYVLCSTKIIVINPANGNEDQVIPVTTPFPQKFFFVENSGGIGAGKYHIWVIGFSAEIEVIDLSGALVTKITTPGTAFKSDLCPYPSHGMVVIADPDPAVQLQMVRASDYAVIVEAFAPNPDTTGGGNSLVYNPTEDRIFVPYPGSVSTPAKIYVVQYIEETATLTATLVTGVEPTECVLDAVLASGTDILQKCEACIEIIEAPCEEETTIQAGLLPDTFYYYTIVDKFGNKYTSGAFTDAAGSLTLELGQTLPKGSTTRWSGPFEIQILVDPLAPFAEILNINGRETDCLILTFK